MFGGLVPLNLNRGLHRVFLLGCALWALFVLVIFPVWTASSARASVDETVAYDVAHPADDAAVRLKREKEIKELYSHATVAHIYRHEVLPNWPFVLGALVLPPLVVYVLARLGAAVVGWLVRGFRT
jgi:hypothetical protein